MSTETKKKRDPREVELDVFWKEIERRWAELKFDPILLEPIRYWAKERKVHPVDHLLFVVQRSVMRGDSI